MRDKECIWLTRLRILIEESLTWGANESDIGANDHGDKRLKSVIFVEKTPVLW